MAYGNCNDCLYSKDEICQNDECSFDPEENCYEFESRQTYNRGYQQGRADEIEEMFSKIDELTVYYAGDKDGNAITPKMLVKEDVIKLLEQLKEQK